MSNIRSRYRLSPLSRTTVLGATRGAFPIVHGTYLGDSDDPGVNVDDAHFPLVGTKEDGTTLSSDAPPKYLMIGYNTAGSDKANVDAQLVVEFWDPTTSAWYQSAPMAVQGSAALDDTGNTTVGELLTVQVHRGATYARFWVPTDLGANQELHVVAYADNGA
jgi:hypothetical protein